MEKRHVKISKFLAKVLRHDPGHIGLTLDPNGWAKVDDIIRLSGGMMTSAEIETVVENNDKQRYSLSDDGRLVRANQGHSISIDLELEQQKPPEILYHGTALRHLASIRQNGIIAMNRQHVHLSEDTVTAIKVGRRHGKPVVLTVQAGNMNLSGHAFYRAVNGVWLTQQVDPAFIVFPRMAKHS